MARWSAAIICVSEHDKNLAIEAGIPAEKLHVIHNGIPVTPLREQPSTPHERVRVVMVGRFNEQKDQELLVRAAASLATIELHFVGDGDNQKKTQELARELGLDHRCCFHGFQENVAAFLESSDVFCLSSHYEGFPMSTLEAMRAGLPVVVSRVGGAGEAIEEGINGFTVAKGDQADLTSKLGLLAQDPVLRAELGNNSREIFERKFSFDAMYEKTMDVYRSVIRGS